MNNIVELTSGLEVVSDMLIHLFSQERFVFRQMIYKYLRVYIITFVNNIIFLVN